MFLHLNGETSQRIQALLSILYNHVWHQVEPSILGMTENCVVLKGRYQVPGRQE